MVLLNCCMKINVKSFSLYNLPDLHLYSSFIIIYIYSFLPFVFSSSPYLVSISLYLYISMSVSLSLIWIKELIFLTLSLYSRYYMLMNYRQDTRIWASSENYFQHLYLRLIHRYTYIYHDFSVLFGAAKLINTYLRLKIWFEIYLRIHT